MVGSPPENCTMRPATGRCVAQRLQHPAHGLEIRLVEVAGRVGVGEADRAGQVAAVGQVDVGQAGVAGVQVAQAAIVRAARGVGHGRVLQAAVVAERPLLHLQVEPGVGVDDVAELAVVRAALLHDHFAAFFEDPGIDQLRAFRAKRLGGLGQALLQGLDGRARIGSFGLYYLKLRHDRPLYGRGSPVLYNQALNGESPRLYGDFFRPNGGPAYGQVPHSGRG